jgi:hypothetical protein
LSKDFKVAVKATSARLRTSYGLAKGSWDQTWTIAIRSGKIWEILERIVSGNVVTPRTFKVPKSAHPFTTMAGIPSSDLQMLLGKVVTRQLSLKAFHTTCKSYKARHRIQLAVLEMIRPKDLNVFTWSEAKAKYPRAANDMLVDMWIPSVVKLKLSEPLSKSFHTSIADNMRMDMKRGEDATSLAQVRCCVSQCSFVVLFL